MLSTYVWTSTESLQLSPRVIQLDLIHRYDSQWFSYDSLLDNSLKFPTEFLFILKFKLGEVIPLVYLGLVRFLEGPFFMVNSYKEVVVTHQWLVRKEYARELRH